MEDIYEAHELLTGRQYKPTIAIIDTGINFLHEDLQGISLEGYNFRENNNWVMDISGHGSSIAGMIGARSDDDYGVDGMMGNLDFSILPIRVASHEDEGLSSDLVRALRYAIDADVDVINISFVSSMYSQLEDDLIQEAISKGIVVVAAVGNDGKAKDLYPASYDGVIGVGSIDYSNKLSVFSNAGYAVDFVAPGEDLFLPTTGHDYELCKGTSYATAYVSAVAAMLKVVNPLYDSEDCLNVLAKNAIDLGQEGWDPLYGNGKIDLVETILDIYNGSAIRVSVPTRAEFSDSLYVINVDEETMKPQYELYPKGICYSSANMYINENKVEETYSLEEQGLYNIVIKNQYGVLASSKVLALAPSMTVYEVANLTRSKVIRIPIIDKEIDIEEIEKNSFVIDNNGDYFDVKFEWLEDEGVLLVRPENLYASGQEYIAIINSGQPMNIVEYHFTIQEADINKLDLYILDERDDAIIVNWNRVDEIDTYALYYRDEEYSSFYPFLDQHGYVKMFPLIEEYGIINNGMDFGEHREYQIVPIVEYQTPIDYMTLEPSEIVGGKTELNIYMERLKGLVPKDIRWINNNLDNAKWMINSGMAMTITCSGVFELNGIPTEIYYIYEVDFDGKTTANKEKNLILSRIVMIDNTVQ